ncbi:MAG: MFS transporter, partial [Actinomycetota bacterium]
STSVGTLLFARTLDGIQGAATGTASMALIMSAFAPEDRVKAMGWWTLVGAGGPVIGVSLGAPIIQAFGWRALFWGQLALLAVAFVVVALIIPRPGHRRSGVVDYAPANREAGWKGMDWIGSWTLSGSVTAVMLGLSLGPSHGWTSSLILGLFISSVFGLAAFIWRIRTAENPLIPPEYFTRRNFVMPMVVRATANFAYFGAFFLFPLVMEQGYGYAIAAVGAVAIARPLLFAIASPVSGYATVRVGERNASVAGMICLTASLLIFALLMVHTPVIWVIVALALSGLGMGIAMPATSSTMANEVDPSKFGVMGAAQMLAMQVGEVAGIQVLVTMQQAAMHHRGLTANSAPAELLATFHTPFFLGAAIALIGVIAAATIRDFDRSDSSLKA